MQYPLTIKYKDTPFPPEMSSLEVVLESTDGCITGTFFATSFHLGFILRPQFFETHGPLLSQVVGLVSAPNSGRKWTLMKLKQMATEKVWMKYRCACRACIWYIYIRISYHINSCHMSNVSKYIQVPNFIAILTSFPVGMVIDRKVCFVHHVIKFQVCRSLWCSRYNPMQSCETTALAPFTDAPNLWMKSNLMVWWLCGWHFASPSEVVQKRGISCRKKIQNLDLVWSRLHFRPCANKDTYLHVKILQCSVKQPIEQPNHLLLLLHDKPQSCCS